MSAHGKRYKAARAKIDRENLYTPVEAIKILNGAAIRGKPTKVRRYTE